ncbi:MAG: hypothetical protein HOV84_10130 [Streptomyces sp.]|nr:hypothetical protein [Streptomyces sp.]
MSHRSLPRTAPLIVTALGATAALGITTAAPVAAAQPTSARAVRLNDDARTTTTVRYGPITLPAASGDDHGETGNRLAFNIAKPCDDCVITSFKPNLVYADGSNANVNTGPMLHHAVLGTHARGDVVCGGPQRMFASGNERVESVLPSGYGIKVRRGERWNMLYDLMNHAPQSKTVYITFTFTHEPAAGSRLKLVTPIWMDAGGCLGSAYDAPDGVSEKVRKWRSTVSGKLVHMRGHLHHAGRFVRTENLTTGKLLCNVVAEEGGSPEFIDLHGHTEISDMPPCSGDSLGTIERGDVLQITSRYESAHAHGDVMGIMAGWVAED